MVLGSLVRNMLLQELGLLFLFLSFPLSLSDPVYMVIGGDAVLRPATMDLLIKNIEWKHNEDIAAEWFGDEVVCFGQFEGRCEVNIDTGELKIKGLNLNDSGIYTPEINGRVLNKIELSVISRVAKPSVKTSCDTLKTDCLFTCEGNTAEAEPITYTWFIDGKQGSSNKELIIREGFGFALSGFSFSCLMKNPVSNETSESIINPVPVVLISITVAASIVVGVATFFSQKRIIEILRRTHLELWRTLYKKELRALYAKELRKRDNLTFILVPVVIVLVVTLVAVIFYIIGRRQGDQYFWISILAPVGVVLVATLVGVFFFIRVLWRTFLVPKSYLVSFGVVLVVQLVVPICLVIGITQADQYNWTSIIVPVVIVSVVTLVAEIFLFIREIWRIILYAKRIRKRFGIWVLTRYDRISIFVPVGVVLVVSVVALISLIIGRGQGDQYIWISILVQARGRLVVYLVAEIVLIIMGQTNTTQHPSNGAVASETQEMNLISETQNSHSGAETETGTPETSNQNQAEAAASNTDQETELTPVEVPDPQTCGPLDTNKDSENSVKMPEEEPETNCEPSADEQEADDREDRPQNTFIKTSVAESAPFEDVTVTTGQNVT